MHLAPLISDLAFILLIAAGMTFVFRRLKQPVVLGYVLTGLVVGPFTPGRTIIEVESFKVWAELGVIFLMFSLGLEFSFRKLIRIGPAATIIGVVQLAFMMLLGFAAARLIGWGQSDGLFLGGMIAISSTTIIIKALEELKLKGMRFADLVFGVLVVEDLAAILILVALSTFGATESMNPTQIALAAAKLVLVVGSWFLVGMFAVPRVVNSFARHGTNEMLVLSAVALCLGLVWLASAFEYSVALGAFLMGSIIAETDQAETIEHLVTPLRDLFGAVFFVSVGMMLDPEILAREWPTILGISALVVGGKIVSVFAGSLIAGQPLADATRIGLSMAQIGEFSFIIGTLGLSLGSIRAELYPIIIATSVITTFTTPYLIRASDPVAAWLAKVLPKRLQAALTGNAARAERSFGSPPVARRFYVAIVRWIASAILVTVLFNLVHAFVPTELVNGIGMGERKARLASWCIAFLASLPFIWAMVTARARRAGDIADDGAGGIPVGRISLAGTMCATVLVGWLSRVYMPMLDAMLATTIVLMLTLFFLRKRIEASYRWYEDTFLSNFSSNSHGTLPEPAQRAPGLSRTLPPWNAKLTELTIPVGSPVAGRSLVELQIRERYGVNVICIERGTELLAPPAPSDKLFPMDQLLIFGDDDETKQLQILIDAPEQLPETATGEDLDQFRTAVVNLSEGHALAGRSIKESRLRENHGCIVVGIEREGKRIENPPSQTTLLTGDIIWLVGHRTRLNALLST